MRRRGRRFRSSVLGSLQLLPVDVHQIHTLSRRAAQIYETSFGPNELNAQDKDSVALLLALRQSGDSSTQNNAYPRGLPPKVDDAPTPKAQAEPSKNWITMMNSAGGGGGMVLGNGATDSPGSTGAHEDDHSQRL